MTAVFLLFQAAVILTALRLIIQAERRGHGVFRSEDDQ